MKQLLLGVLALFILISPALAGDGALVPVKKEAKNMELFAQPEGGKIPDDALVMHAAGPGGTEWLKKLTGEQKDLAAKAVRSLRKNDLKAAKGAFKELLASLAQGTQHFDVQELIDVLLRKAFLDEDSDLFAKASLAAFQEKLVYAYRGYIDDLTDKGGDVFKQSPQAGQLSQIRGKQDLLRAIQKGLYVAEKDLKELRKELAEMLQGNKALINRLREARSKMFDQAVNELQQPGGKGALGK